LPNLPLESSQELSDDQPAVVTELWRGQAHVIAANARARQCGIEPGLKLNAARALAGSLRIKERSLHSERAALEALAAWLTTLTPTVSIVPPENVLIEVLGSLKLFGSLDVIKAKLEVETSRRGLTARIGTAPTALASVWLARGSAEDVSSLDELPSRLGALPLGVTRWPEPVQALLRDLGARTLADCLRLPRDGFARRVGAIHLHELDLALGRDVDLRAEFSVPVRWAVTVDLSTESFESAIFMEAIEHMLERLEKELRKQQAQIRSLEIIFRHLRRAPTLESFVLTEAVHERARLTSLLRDRIERLVLPAPAVAVGLRTGAYEPMSVETLHLFEKSTMETAARALFERLIGRFGRAGVHGMRLIAEHRPERAWQTVDCLGAEPRVEPPPFVPQSRPLWLLREPVPLESAAARAYYGGSVELNSGPERIESGWWDEQDIGRDYYVAVSSLGQRLWVYRDRVSRDWHLHGLFG
jgi:protein ImuB